MPIEVGIWKLGSGAETERIHFSPLKAEGKLEDILDHDITILDPRLMVIGRQGNRTLDAGKMFDKSFDHRVIP